MSSLFNSDAQKASPPRNSERRVLAALAVVALVGSGALLAARHSSPRAAVVTLSPNQTQSAPAPASRGRRAVLLPPGLTSASTTDAAPAPTCGGPTPGPSWTCENGKWVMTSGVTTPPAATGGGHIDRANGCVTEQPGPGLTCQAGLWTLGSADPTPPTQGPTASRTSTPASATPAVTCAGPKPGDAWTCDNGAWTLPATPATPTPAAASPPTEPSAPATQGPTQGPSAPVVPPASPPN